MMADSRRELWLAALLAKIQVEYPEAMAAVPSYVPEELPACTVWDDTDEAEVSEYGDQSIITTVNLEATEEITEAVGDLASQMLAQRKQGQELLARLVKAATGGDRTLAGLTDDITCVSGAVQYPEDGGNQISAGISIRVRWRHELGDPYTAGA